VKLRLIAVLAVIALCSFAASAQTFSFWNSAGTEQYCNFNVITYNSGGVAGGYDDTVDVCGFEFNSPIVGFDATVANDGEPAFGKGIVVGDGIYDASADAYTGIQWTVFTAAAYSKQNKKTGRFTGKYGWVGEAGSYSGSYFGDNYGYTSASAPVKSQVAGGKTTAGKSHNAVRR
jgi:hypothetical protein